jgi:hypothetical protein
MEFSARECGKVGNNKIEVSQKIRSRKRQEDRRTLPTLSPADYGALQRGFHLASLRPPEKPTRLKEDWRSRLRDRAKKLATSGTLEYAS